MDKLKLKLLFCLFLIISMLSGVIVFLTRDNNEFKGRPRVVSAPSVTAKNSQTDSLIKSELSTSPAASKTLSKNKPIHAASPSSVLTASSSPSAPLDPLSKTSQLSTSSNMATIKINGQIYNIDLSLNIPTVYEAMNELRFNRKVDFSDKNYSGLGHFIESINGIKNNAEKNNKFWIYYINGKPATSGISNYKLNNNDLIEWRYEKDTF